MGVPASIRAGRVRRGENENVVQPNLDWLTLQESDARRFIAHIFKHSMVRKRVSWCHAIPGVQGGIVTLKLHSKYISFLPRR